MRLKLILFSYLLCFSFYQMGYSQDGLKIADHENIAIMIEGLNSSTVEMGLTESRLQSRTEVRLRQVGLKPSLDTSGPFLYVFMTTVGNAFTIRITFNRWVYFHEDPDDLSSELLTELSRTYLTSVTGTHSYEPEYLVSILDTQLDQFISEYLRAND